MAFVVIEKRSEHESSSMEAMSADSYIVQVTLAPALFCERVHGRCMTP
jgi:hypothetical protein